MSKLQGRRVGITVVLSAVLVAVAATTGFLGTGDDDSRTVTAYFSDAHPLIPGNSVRAAGVEVGTIEDISIEDGTARVDMAVDESLSPLYRDATAKIVTENLLGEHFVQIGRGSPEVGAIAEPAVIPEERTSRVVDLQQVLNAVDTPTSKALAAIITTLGEGVSGQAENIAATIKALEPAMTQSNELVSILREQNMLLGRLVANAQGPASAMAGSHGERLDRLVATSTETLSAVGANRLAVEQTLRQLPSTIASARRTLARVSGVADPTTRTLASIRPVTDNLTDISRELQAFSDAADPALAGLRPVLERGATMLEEARPLVHALRPAGKHARSVASSARTLMDEALSTRLTHLMEFVKGWSLATSDYDAISHYFKAIVPVTPKALGQTGGGPVPGLEKPVPDVGLLPEAPSLPLPGRDEDGMQTLPPLNDGGGTGLTQEQENSMLTQLLGGS